MSDTDWITDLARLAEAATPGPWYVSPARDVYAGEGKSSDLVVAEECEREDAEFIAAANPATILRLLTTLHDIAEDLARVAEHRRVILRNADVTNRLVAAVRERFVKVRAERDALAAKVAAVEALTEEPEMALDSIQIRHRYVDIRAALAAPTDTTKEN